MKKTSAVNAGNAPALAHPIQITVVNERVILQYQNIMISIILEEPDATLPPGACRGCGCIAAIQPYKNLQA